MTGAYLKSKRDISTLSVESAVAYFHRLAIRVSHKIRDTTVYISPITNREMWFSACVMSGVSFARKTIRGETKIQTERPREK